MATLNIDTAEEALALLEDLDSVQGFDSVSFGRDFGLTVKIDGGYHSEMPAQYLDAYHRQKRVIYQLVALIENGTPDTKSLTARQLEEYRYSVSVREGSSVFDDNLTVLLGRLFEEAISKMTGEQIALVVLGVAVISATGLGFRAWIQSRKEQRLEELAAGERRDALAGFNAASTDQVNRLAQVMEKMIAAGGPARTAAEASEELNSAQLRAAAQTERVEIEGLEIDQGTARELRARSRRRAEEYKITKEMRVVDVNTADATQTAVVLEDLETGEQHKVAFSDRVVGETKLRILHEALRVRSTALFRLQIRALDEDEARIQQVIDVQTVPGPDHDSDHAG